MTVGGRTLTEKEAELNPFREMDSVMMTAGGFISPAREGRLPEALRPAVSAMATAAIPHELDTATPPSTPTPPPMSQGKDSTITPKPTPKKRGPVPGSKHKKKKEPIIHKASNPDDSGDDLSGDETYEPPAGTMINDSSSSKKLSVFQRKVNKPRKASPSKHVDNLNSSTESTSNYSEVHVDDIIQNVINRGIEESSHTEDSHPTTHKGTPRNTGMQGGIAVGQPPGSSKSDFLPSHAQTPKAAPTIKAQAVTNPGPKKRGRKKKSELLRLEAEKAALDASKSESSDVDICYDAPIRKKPKLDNTATSSVEQPAAPKIPQRPITPPDTSILLNNPLIPKVPYGFGDLGSFNVPTAMEEGEILDDSPERPSSASRPFDLITSPDHLRDFSSNVDRHNPALDKHERKKEKSVKKSKKDKKDKDKSKDRDKNKDRDKLKKEDKKDKKERNKELRREKKREEKERLREERRERKREEKERERKEKKKKKLMKKPNVEMPPLFAPAAEVLPVVQSQPKPQPKVPTIKIKEIKPDDNKPKNIFKNVSGEYSASSDISSKNPHFPKTKETSDDFASFSIHQKDKKPKSTKKKEKSKESPYPQEIEPLKIHIHKKSTKHENRERISSGDIPKRKVKDNQPFSHGPANPELVDIDPGQSSSNSPQISGISSPSSFVGGGTITTQTVGKYVDQGIFFVFANQRI